MICRNVNIAFVAFVIALLPFMTVAGKTKDVKPYLEVAVDRADVVEGERLIYEVALYSPDPSVAGVELVEMPGFNMLPHTQSSPDTQLTEVEINGVKYYKAVIDRYFVGVNRKGKYNIKGGAYRLGLNKAVRVDDPFWGSSLQNRVVVMDLKSPDLTVKVSPLPEKGRPEAFSGAVGEFEASIYLPEGEIRAGEDCYVVIDIAGSGDLTDAVLPDIRKAFPDGIQFKSMTDNRSHYVKDGKLGSEIEMECVFHPHKEGSYVIKGIEFVYYNPVTGKYSTCIAPDLTIEVSGALPAADKPSIIIDV